MQAGPHALLTAGQVAKLLNLKPSTIYDAAARGRLPCVRLWSGRRRAVVRFVPDDIEKFIRERATLATPKLTANPARCDHLT